jgi:hypothetical protein
MDSEIKAARAGSASSVSVGERVTVGDLATEYVVVSVDHATGRLELLRLSPGRIESDVPVSSVTKRSSPEPRLDS